MADKAIQAGNWEINGSFSLNTGGSFSSFSAQPEVGYFISDRFSVGGAVHLSSSTYQGQTYRSTGLGPKASFYFWESGPLVSLVTQQIYYTSSETSALWSGMTALGGRYFVTPNVAFGVDLAARYAISGGPDAAFAQSLGLTGAFATYF